jgi:hypothetical protein
LPPPGHYHPFPSRCAREHIHRRTSSRPQSRCYPSHCARQLWASAAAVMRTET